MIKYIGSKRVLVPDLLRVIRTIQREGSVIDLFSGTSRVGHALKGCGYRVLANDHNAYAETLARCYVAADEEEHRRAVSQLVRELNALPGNPGYFTTTFCERSRFFQPKNGARIDAIREAIDRKGLDPERKAVILVSLMEAADRVDSTTGLQMAYLKKWAPRALNDIELRVPELRPRARGGKGEATGLDAEVAVKQLRADVCYLDPPYNQHKYLGNYHIWESLVLWDKPEVYGVACKRMDCRERKSAFNAKGEARSALRSVIRDARAAHLVVSFNNEGYIARADIEEMLGDRGEVVVFAHDFKRYVGAQIGIHNPQGERVGEVSHLRNTEYIYVTTQDGAVVDRLRALGARSGSEVPERPRPVPDGTLPAAVPAGDAVADVQARLRSLVEEHGSLSAVEARAILGAEPGAVRAALRALVAVGAVEVTGATRGTRYVATSSGMAPSAAITRTGGGVNGAVDSGRANRGLAPAVLALLGRARDASSEELQRGLGVDASTLRATLKSLQGAGRITTSGQRRGMRYSLAPAEASSAAPDIRPRIDSSAVRRDLGAPNQATAQQELFPG